MTIESLESPDDNRVRYSEVDCVGNWEYLGTEDGDLRFREVADPEASAKARCNLIGEVTLTPRNDDRLGYRYEPNNMEFKAGGTLTREG